MSKPPIFSVPLTGTNAQQYLHRARMFRRAAIELTDYVNGEQNWPKYALLTHAIELALKAFVEQVLAGKRASPRPKNHDLADWYQLALQCGLPEEPSMARHIEVLNELHMTHYTRYPQQRATPVPGTDNIADATVDHLIDLATRAVNTR